MTIQVIDVEHMQKFSSEGVEPIMLHQSKGCVTLLLCLEANQEVGPCSMTMQVLYVVLSGKAQLNAAGEQEQSLNASSMIVVPAGVVRSLLATERSRVLAIQMA